MTLTARRNELKFDVNEQQTESFQHLAEFLHSNMLNNRPMPPTCYDERMHKSK